MEGENIQKCKLRKCVQGSQYLMGHSQNFQYNKNMFEIFFF